MSQNNQTPGPLAKQQQHISEDEISLIDIYLTVKRNSRLFFSVIILSFLISLVITFYRAQNQVQAISHEITEYILIIEIGRVYGNELEYGLIDSADNTLQKIKNVYIPNLNQHLVLSAEQIPNSQLLIIKVLEASEKINPSKILLKLADNVLKDHNSSFNLNNQSSISVKPTRVIQQPIKRVKESTITSTSKLLIPTLGLILGIFLAFFAIFINKFMKKVKEAENVMK